VIFVCGVCVCMCVVGVWILFVCVFVWGRVLCVGFVRVCLFFFVF